MKKFEPNSSRSFGSHRMRLASQNKLLCGKTLEASDTNESFNELKAHELRRALTVCSKP